MQLELMRSFKGDGVRSFCVAFACFVLRELIVCMFVCRSKRKACRRCMRRSCLMRTSRWKIMGRKMRTMMNEGCHGVGTRAFPHIRHVCLHPYHCYWNTVLYILVPACLCNLSSTINLFRALTITSTVPHLNRSLVFYHLQQ